MTATAATSSTYTYTPTTTNTASSLTTTSTADQQDRFLKLLVAQMSNQDPMNPMDNAQMTSQIAQINTVTGISALNDTMKSMTSQMSAMQVLQAGNLVGHSVLTEGNKVAFTDAKTGVGAVELAADASDVTILVKTPGGQTVDTVSLGALKAGQHGFTLDATNYPTDTQLNFTVVASNGGQFVQSTSLMRDTVSAVSSATDGSLMLNLQNSGDVAYKNVHAVL